MHEALLDQVRFDHVLDGVALLADCRGQVVQPHRAAREALDDGLEQLAIHQVEAGRIDVEHRERGRGRSQVDSSPVLHLGIVAYPAQQAVGDARGATGATCDLVARSRIDVGAQQACRAGDDRREVRGVVELESRDDAEAIAQRVGQHARARGCADQRERLQVELDGSRRWSLADQDVDLEVLECWIEDFLDHRGQAMDLVDEQHVVALEVGQHRREVARALEHRAGGLAQVHTHLRGDDVRERGLAQTRRTEQQHVVERLAALAGRTDEDVELLACLGLADVLGQRARAQRALDLLLVG